MKRKKLGILVTHPIQYYAPLYRELARSPALEITVFYAHRQTPEGQSGAGFDVAFDWDIPLLDGYPHRFLTNASRRPGTDTFFGCSTPEIRGILESERFDAFLVHGWYNRSYWQAIRACWSLGLPVMVRGDSQLAPERTGAVAMLKRPVYRWFIPKFDACLCVGSRARDYLLHYGADPKRCFFSPHAVDNDFFAGQRRVHAPRRREIRQSWGLPEDAAVFLFAGKFIDKKRPMDFLRAIAQCGRPEAAGLMAGDGPLRAECERFARSRGLAVSFAGFLNQSEISKAFAVSDALVLASDFRETWGLVVNEAMAAGLPTLVSRDCGCAPDLVEEGVTGWTFACGDVTGLARRMAGAASDRSALRAMSEQAAERIGRYSLAAAARGIEEAVSSVIS